MRPTFERAIVTVEASSEKAAIRVALEQAGQLSDDQWALLETEKEQPIVEIALSEEEADGSERDLIAYLSEVQHAYALLQADLEEASGFFIVPTWLSRQPELAIADITQDWKEDMSGIYEAGVEGFIAWLGLQTRPTNVVDFFAERDKRRSTSRKPTDS